MKDTERKVGRGRRRHPDARQNLDAILPSALADEPFRADECGASLVSKRSDIGTPERRQRNDGRSAFHTFSIERSTYLRDPSTD
jgi:hypothetical protein